MSFDLTAPGSKVIEGAGGGTGPSDSMRQTVQIDQGNVGNIPVQVINPAVPKGYQQIASLGAAQKLTVPGGATSAILVGEGAEIRWRDDGAAPTASIGMPLYAGQPFRITNNLTTISVIQVAAGAVLNVSYYG